MPQSGSKKGSGKTTAGKRKSGERDANEKRPAAAVGNSNDALEQLDACGRGLLEADALTDAGLPMAVGGVAVDAMMEDEACGCDVEFDDFDSTPDDELPDAKGGVA